MKSSNNYTPYNDKNDFNCNNKIIKIEINNIHYNNGKTIIIKNFIGSKTTKDNSGIENRINKIHNFQVTHNIENMNNNLTKNNTNRNENKMKGNNNMIKSYLSARVSSLVSRHISSKSSINNITK